MMDDVVLRVENLGKVFKVYPSAWGRIKEWFTFGRRRYHRKFQALKGISFEVRKGGFLGIIGPNGAGKSTLLKLITGILDPTTGSYQSQGKVLSLLELSGGLDQDLTGRENIIRSAQLLGFPDGYVEQKIQQIMDFAELGEFFDQPIGTYSSGMRIRLAFSMFAFLDCDILILDEVLAVGDIFFRQKCYARLEELIKKNVAVILVTHSTGTVRQYCDDVIVLKKGEIYYHGSSDIAIQKYFELKKDQGIKIKASDTYMEEDYVSESSQQSGDLFWPSDSVFNQASLPKKSENNLVKLTHLAVCDKQGNPCQVFKQGETVFFYASYQLKENVGVPVAGIHLLTVTNLLVHLKNSLQINAEHPLSVAKGDTLRICQKIKLDLAPGNYVFNLTLGAMHPLDYKERETFSPADFNEKIANLYRGRSAGHIEIIVDPYRHPAGLHGGICNLDGEISIQAIPS